MRRISGLAVLGVLAPIVAFAQAPPPIGREPRTFSVERLKPGMQRDGWADVHWAGIEDLKTVELGLYFKYANDPLFLTREASGTNEALGALVSDAIDLDLFLSVKVASWLEVAGGTQLFLLQNRPDTLGGAAGIVTQLTSITAGGFGDLWITPKVRVLNQEDHYLELAILPAVTIPTARSTDYQGDTSFTFGPEIAIARAWGGFKVAGNFGARFRKRVTWLNLIVDDELLMRGGLGYRFFRDGDNPLEIGAVISGSTPLESPFKNGILSPFEVLGTVMYGINQSFHFEAGAGAGITSGVGAPDFRAFVGWRYTFLEKERISTGDFDKDGLADLDDHCPREPGPKNNLGCPRIDTDKDGLLDPEDRCPKEPGPKENFGCPDLDRDDDKIVDRLDACPVLAEDFDKKDDNDGAPDWDNDNDGVVDAVDRCPDEPGPMENKGCPETDIDADGILDRFDNCPNEAGAPENNGCEKKQLVSLTATKLEIKDKVYFKTDQAVIEKRSYLLLDNVADVMQEHPEITSFRIEGHTDNVGVAEYNKDLSQRRADAVMEYLVARGVDANRLEAVGFGMEKPIDTNKTSQGRANNRRVEFNIPAQIAPTLRPPGAGQIDQ